MCGCINQPFQTKTRTNSDNQFSLLFILSQRQRRQQHLTLAIPTEVTVSTIDHRHRPNSHITQLNPPSDSPYSNNPFFSIIHPRPPPLHLNFTMPAVAPPPLPTSSAHPRLTNNKKDGKKATVIPPPVVIWDDEMRIEYRRDEDAKRAFLGEVRVCAKRVSQETALRSLVPGLS